MGASLFGTGVLFLVVGFFIVRIFGEKNSIKIMMQDLNEADTAGTIVWLIGAFFAIIGALVWLWT